MKKSFALIGLFMVCFLAAGCGAGLVVDSSGDEPDINLSDGECKTVNNDCTLRAAIMEANVSDDISKITFDSNLTISPATNLPPLTSGNTHILGGGLSIVLDGSQNTEYPQHGIMILDSHNNLIQGLKIQHNLYGIHILAEDGESKTNIIGINTPSTSGNRHNVLVYNYIGVLIEGQDAFENVIGGNYIGVDSDGKTAMPNDYDGVQIRESAHHNLIGSHAGNIISDGGNLISGNVTGIKITDNSHHNHISGNLIGTQESGNVDLGNAYGIKIIEGSANNIIGIDSSGEGQSNLISGNDWEGITLHEADFTIISGNLIGVNSTGDSAIPNKNGIMLYISSQNIIGTDGNGNNDANEGNLISGNTNNGIGIYDNNSIYNVISGNKIGTDISGTSAIGNGGSGISAGGDSTQIGTDGDGTSDDLESNLISGNLSQGIGISSTGSTVSGNLIGVDITGSYEIGNSGWAIVVAGNGNLIGTNGDGNGDLAELNLISGNRYGIEITGGNSNTIAGNYVGTDINGFSAIPNGLNTTGAYGAIHLVNGSNNNVIGTNGDGSGDNLEGNLISGNSLRGIVLDGSNSNVIAGNSIGTNESGSAVLGNTLGLLIKNGSSHNLIGTNNDGTSDLIEGNVISGSTESSGIQINASQNQISGNYIGTDKSGLADLGNKASGIFITETVTDILIGGSNSQSNTIAFNDETGILIYGPSTNDIQILNNSIFSNNNTGIDLAETPSDIGVSLNDPGDLDNGPNDLMNFPELTGASSIFLSLAINGEMVNSLPYTSYLVQFFDNESCDSPSGYGEGKTHIGSKQVFTDSYGNGAFSAIFSFTAPAGHFITATSTAYGKTSEFSACVEVTAEENTYSGEVLEDPCDQFNQDEMELFTFNYRPGSNLFSLYVKNSEFYPKEGPAGPWKFTAVLGEEPSILTSFLEFEDRAYFDFVIPEVYLNTTQTLKVFSNYCFPPIYINEEVSILTADPTGPSVPPDVPGTCHKDLGPRACPAAGGTYIASTGECYCR